MQEKRDTEKKNRKVEKVRKRKMSESKHPPKYGYSKKICEYCERKIRIVKKEKRVNGEIKVYYTANIYNVNKLRVCPSCYMRYKKYNTFESINRRSCKSEEVKKIEYEIKLHRIKLESRLKTQILKNMPPKKALQYIREKYKIPLQNNKNG